MALEITLVPPPPGPRIYRHRVFRRARDFGRKTYRRRRMGGPGGEVYIIAEQPIVFPPEDYCHCNGHRPGCIPGPAPCDFRGLGVTDPESTRSKAGILVGVIAVSAIMLVALSDKPEPRNRR